MAAFGSAFAAVRGVRLHYLEWAGDQGAPAVVCLHGITANAHAFLGLADALSPRHRVLALDLRGRGESDKPADGYDVLTHAADVVGLLDALGIQRAAVVGWSLGGKVALALAATYADRVERLVLVDPPVATSPDARAALAAFWGRLDNQYVSVDDFLERMRAGGVFRAWTASVDAYLRADVETGTDGVVRHRVPRRVPDAELAAEHLSPTRSFYSRVRCPTLVLRATRPLRREGDQVLGADEAREMAASLPDARLLEVQDADHFSILLDMPPDIVQAVRGFLDPRDGAGQSSAAPSVSVQEFIARIGDLKVPGDGFADDLEKIQAEQPKAQLPDWRD